MKKNLQILINILVVFVLFFGINLITTSKASAVSLADGSLIKSQDYPAVYYYDATNGKRYVFPNQKTYNTWYNDFSQVVTITATELASIPIGGNMVYRAGTKLIKITTDPKVYAVSPYGQLHAIDSESRAKLLYGDNWAQLVDDVPDSFFVNYAVSTAINSDTYPDGAVVERPDGKRYVIVTGKKRLLIDNTFTDNGFFEKYVISTALDYPDGEQVKEKESYLANPIVHPQTCTGNSSCSDNDETPEKISSILLTTNYSQLAANNTDSARIDFTLKNEKGEVATTYNGEVTIMANDLLKPSTYSTKATNGLGSVLVTAGYKTGQAEVVLSAGGVNKSITMDILSVEALQPRATNMSDLSLISPFINQSGPGEEFSIPFNAIPEADYYVAQASNMKNFSNIVLEKEIMTSSCQGSICYATFSFSNPSTQVYYFRVKGVRNTLGGFWNTTLDGNTVNHTVIGTDI